MRVKRERRRVLEREYLSYRERAYESLRAINERYRAIRDRISDNVRRIRDRYSNVAISIRSRTIETAKKAKLEGKANVSYSSRDEAVRDKAIYERYAENLDLLINNIKLLSQAGLPYIPEDFPMLSSTKALAEYYFTPYIPAHDHFTMYAVKLTPLTISRLAGELADFYVNYELELKDYLSPYRRVADYFMNLFELLLSLMRKKGRRERVRNKSKGHYGRISYNEPIHDMITTDFTPYSSSKLIHCILDSYWLKRWKAMSIGFPELANKIIHSSVLAILVRKGRYTKLYPDLNKKAELEDRLRRLRYYRRKL